MKTIGTFTIIKNEIDYIGYNIMAVLNYVDAMYFLDGESMDGTKELVRYIQKKYDKDRKIHWYTQPDCKNYSESYMALWNLLLGYIKTDYCWFLHPDMICVNPYIISDSIQLGEVRYTYKIVSFAGDRKHIFSKGRDDRWASIYRNSNELHFYGKYGADNEDFYFRDFTGDEHEFYKNINFLPYTIKDTDIEVYHYCDTRTKDVRKDKMRKIISTNNNGRYTKEEENLIINNHPRVIIDKSNYDFGRNFEITETKLEEPGVFKRYAEEFERFRK